MAKVALSDTHCRNLKCPEGSSSVDLRDTYVRGLELRATAGAKAWRLRYTRKSDGVRRQIPIGTFPAMTLAEARARAGALKVLVLDGADPANGVEERKEAPTFLEVVTEWQTNHALGNRCERVRKDDQSMLDRYVLPSLGGIKLHDIGRREISTMLSGVRSSRDRRKGHTKRDTEPRTLTHRPNRVFELVRAIVRWSHSQGIIQVDPTAGMKRPIKKEPARERELSADEIAIFWRNLEQLPSTAGLRLALKLALATGQRIGEVCGIAMIELDLDGEAPVWRIPRARVKNGEGHRVPLSPFAVSLIRQAVALQSHGNGEAASEWLFPARAKRDRSKGPIEPNAATVAVFRGRDKIGLPDFRVHDLRRTAATRMAEMGVNPHTISLVLNHISASKSTVTSKVYIHYSFDREKREALDAWGARLQDIIQSRERSPTPSMGN